ncbi:hypothetical protein MSKU15_0477 [Komagataeibacter diospyri]|nr:hypothetical protein MSKU15_0477 [Komagataeibacter diospyri]
MPWLSMTTTGWSGLASRGFTIEHQADIMDGFGHETAHQPAERPIDSLPWTKMNRQHFSSVP